MGTRKGHGKYIESPERMWELFLQYVEYKKKNPIFKREYVGKDGTPVNTPLNPPLSWEGFEVYLGMNEIAKDIKDYSSNKDGRYSEYIPIVTRIKDFCFVNNFEGAGVGIFNPSIIARKLGLVDKQENKVQVEQPLFPNE